MAPLSSVGVVFGNICDDNVQNLSDVAQDLGATILAPHNSARASYLVCSNVLRLTDGTDPYLVAIQSNPGLHVVSPAWLLACRADGAQVDPGGFLLKPLSGIQATITNFTVPERESNMRKLRDAGASVQGELYRTMTHVICNRPGGAKYEHARSWGLWLVSPAWVDACVKAGHRVDEKAFAADAGGPPMPAEGARHHARPSRRAASAVDSGMTTGGAGSGGVTSGLGGGSIRGGATKLGANKATSAGALPPQPPGSRPLAPPAAPEGTGDAPPFTIPDDPLDENYFLHWVNAFFVGLTAKEETHVLTAVRESGLTRQPTLHSGVTHIVFGTTVSTAELAVVRDHMLDHREAVQLVRLHWLWECINARAVQEVRPFLVPQAVLQQAVGSLAPAGAKGAAGTGSLAPAPTARTLPAMDDYVQLEPEPGPNGPAAGPAAGDALGLGLGEAARPGAAAAGGVFTGLWFTLAAVAGSAEEQEAARLVRQGGGMIMSAGTERDVKDDSKRYAVCPFSLPTAEAERLAFAGPTGRGRGQGPSEFGRVRPQHRVTLDWLRACLEKRQLMPISHFTPLYKPLPYALPCPKFKGVVVAVSQYHAEQREGLQELITRLGGTYTDKLNKRVHFLVVPDAAGDKYAAAVRWRIPTVRLEWVLESAYAGRPLEDQVPAFLPVGVTPAQYDANRRGVGAGRDGGNSQMGPSQMGPSQIGPSQMPPRPPPAASALTQQQPERSQGGFLMPAYRAPAAQPPAPPRPAPAQPDRPAPPPSQTAPPQPLTPAPALPTDPTHQQPAGPGPGIGPGPEQARDPSAASAPAPTEPRPAQAPAGPAGPTGRVARTMSGSTGPTGAQDPEPDPGGTAGPSTAGGEPSVGGPPGPASGPAQNAPPPQAEPEFAPPPQAEALLSLMSFMQDHTHNQHPHEMACSQMDMPMPAPCLLRPQEPLDGGDGAGPGGSLEGSRQLGSLAGPSSLYAAGDDGVPVGGRAARGSRKRVAAVAVGEAPGAVPKVAGLPGRRAQSAEEEEGFGVAMSQQVGYEVAPLMPPPAPRATRSTSRGRGGTDSRGSVRAADAGNGNGALSRGVEPANDLTRELGPHAPGGTAATGHGAKRGARRLRRLPGLPAAAAALAGSRLGALVLSTPFQCAAQATVGLLATSVFVVVRPVTFPISCLAPVLYTAWSVLLSQDNHLGSKLQLSLALVAAPVSPAGRGLPAVGSGAHTAALCGLGAAALLLLVPLRAAVGPGRHPPFMWFAGFTACLALGVGVLSGQLLPSIHLAWKAVVWSLVRVALLAGGASGLAAALVLPSLASDELEADAAALMRGLGAGATRFASRSLQPCCRLTGGPPASSGAAGPSAQAAAGAARAPSVELLDGPVVALTQGLARLSVVAPALLPPPPQLPPPPPPPRPEGPQPAEDGSAAGAGAAAQAARPLIAGRQDGRPGAPEGLPGGTLDREGAGGTAADSVVLTVTEEASAGGAAAGGTRHVRLGEPERGLEGRLPPAAAGGADATRGTAAGADTGAGAVGPAATGAAAGPLRSASLAATSSSSSSSSSSEVPEPTPPPGPTSARTAGLRAGPDSAGPPRPEVSHLSEAVSAFDEGLREDDDAFLRMLAASAEPPPPAPPAPPWWACLMCFAGGGGGGGGSGGGGGAAARALVRNVTLPPFLAPPGGLRPSPAALAAASAKPPHQPPPRPLPPPPPPSLAARSGSILGTQSTSLLDPIAGQLNATGNTAGGGGGAGPQRAVAWAPVAALRALLARAKACAASARLEPPWLAAVPADLDAWCAVLSRCEALLGRVAALDGVAAEGGAGQQHQALHDGSLVALLGVDIIAPYRLSYARVAAACAAMGLALDAAAAGGGSGPVWAWWGHRRRRAQAAVGGWKPVGGWDEERERLGAAVREAMGRYWGRLRAAARAATPHASPWPASLAAAGTGGEVEGGGGGGAGGGGGGGVATPTATAGVVVPILGMTQARLLMFLLTATDGVLAAVAELEEAVRGLLRSAAPGPLHQPPATAPATAPAAAGSSSAGLGCKPPDAKGEEPGRPSGGGVRQQVEQRGGGGEAGPGGEALWPAGPSEAGGGAEGLELAQANADRIGSGAQEGSREGPKAPSGVKEGPVLAPDSGGGPMEGPWRRLRRRLQRQWGWAWRVAEITLGLPMLRTLAAQVYDTAAMLARGRWRPLLASRTFQFGAKYWAACSGVMVLLLVLVAAPAPPLPRSHPPLYGYIATAVSFTERVESTLSRSALRAAGTLLGGGLGLGLLLGAQGRAVDDPAVLLPVIGVATFVAGLLSGSRFKLATILTLVTLGAMTLCQYRAPLGPAAAGRGAGGGGGSQPTAGSSGGGGGVAAFCVGCRTTEASLKLFAVRVLSVIAGCTVPVLVSSIILPWYTSAWALETMAGALRGAAVITRHMYDRFFAEGYAALVASKGQDAAAEALAAHGLTREEAEACGAGAGGRGDTAASPPPSLQALVWSPLVAVQASLMRDTAAWSRGLLATPEVVPALLRSCLLLADCCSALQLVAVDTPPLGPGGRLGGAVFARLVLLLHGDMQELLDLLDDLAGTTSRLLCGSSGADEETQQQQQARRASAGRRRGSSCGGGGAPAGAVGVNRSDGGGSGSDGGAAAQGLRSRNGGTRPGAKQAVAAALDVEMAPAAQRPRSPAAALRAVLREMSERRAMVRRHFRSSRHAFHAHVLDLAEQHLPYATRPDDAVRVNALMHAFVVVLNAATETARTALAHRGGSRERRD
ncbi:hypothetical protein HYH03_017786 [Edaphochlamys debaryana]|uniref:BRCT domain-containing protein n=1 Tax=Edaphochlamys debaryana TaxID=47281 RepID=A0A835XID9_9CHLO|nr:hypothetical protein HYH03_017786 [Edaphochlamys debaryana]|eukprot:KAG2483338.1 hypothetical protein HYH03_017786 [Edaphochlamys debaryana]